VLLLDANLLLYAVNEDASHHKKAKAWLEARLSGSETIGLTWNVALAFLRLTTRPGLFRHPLHIEVAMDLLAAWLDQDVVTIVHPGPHHFLILRELLQATGTGGNLTSDAHLAAIAIEHGATLCSLDRDFARFTRLLWKNPLP
jgi:toxin-antitoxin system PIN domain toxin